MNRREIKKALLDKNIKIVCTHLDSGYSQKETPFIVNGEYREHLIRMYSQDNKMFWSTNDNQFNCLYDKFIIEG